MRLINADELKKAIHNYYDESTTEESSIVDIIDNAPTVEPTFGVFKSICCEDCDKNARPQGEWTNKHFEHADCSVCGGTNDYHGDFCKYCGAYMRGKEE